MNNNVNVNHVKQFLIRNISYMDQLDTLFLKQLFTLVKGIWREEGVSPLFCLNSSKYYQQAH